MRRRKFCYLIVFFFSFLVSCEKQDDILAKEISTNVTIVYLEANNDLGSEARKTINDLEDGFANYPNGIILAYIKDNNQYGYLLQIAADKNPHRIVSDTIKVFDVDMKTEGIQVHSVLSDIKDLYKSDQYNLILWSHGTAWAPAPDYYSGPQVFSFGEDRGKQMDILDLRDALPMHFNYIIFDACSMASIEVLYEFKDKANYIIASPTDVLSEGFPYRKIVPYLFTGSKENILKIAKTYFEHYDAQNGMYRSATISVVDLSKLEKLASSLRSITRKGDSVFSTESVERLDFTIGFPVPIYDFGSFMSKNYAAEEFKQLSTVMDEVIIYKNNTPEFLGNKLSTFSGLTISSPRISDRYYDYYLNLEWNKATGMYYRSTQ